LLSLADVRRTLAVAALRDGRRWTTGLEFVDLGARNSGARVWEAYRARGARDLVPVRYRRVAPGHIQREIDAGADTSLLCRWAQKAVFAPRLASLKSSAAAGTPGPDRARVEFQPHHRDTFGRSERLDLSIRSHLADRARSRIE
jgi:hypothetical protein